MAWAHWAMDVISRRGVYIHLKWHLTLCLKNSATRSWLLLQKGAFRTTKERCMFAIQLLEAVTSLGPKGEKKSLVLEVDSYEWLLYALPIL